MKCPYCDHEMTEHRYTEWGKDGPERVRYWRCPICGERTGFKREPAATEESGASRVAV